MDAQATRRTLLDDMVYLVVLDDRRSPDIADGVLERRCLTSSSTPAGSAGVGGFAMLRDGTWTAWISAPSATQSGADRRIVATGVERMEAVVALWRARHDAYFNHFSL
jgi:hypothetical protein